jgi:hypothetical protein
MNILDKIALNRLIKIITSFILGVLKILQPHVTNDNVPNVNKPKFPWIRNKIDSITKKTKK